MPPLKAPEVSNLKAKFEGYKLPDFEKKGIMCTECEKVKQPSKEEQTWQR